MRPDLLRRMLDLDRARVPYALCTVVSAKGSVPGKAGFAMVVTADEAWGTVGGAGLEERVKREARALVAAGKATSEVRRFDLANWKEGGLDSVCGGTVEVSIHVAPPRPHLLLLGGGHVAKAIGDAAALLDWRISVVDDRPAFVGKDRFPHAEALLVGEPAEVVRKLDLTVYSHAYVLGYDHHKDAAALGSLARFAGAVGVVGSAAKRKSLLERARAAGADEAFLDRVRCPIGLPIGAHTPEEIAVAVLAEILQGRPS